MIEFLKLIKEKIEYRFDPLTKEQARIYPDRARRIKPAEAGESELSQLIERSKETCPFCPGRIRAVCMGY